MTMFGTLNPDGTLANVCEIKQSDLGKCPFVIFDASHYCEDGSCLCDDAEHRKNVMIKQWGYKRSDFKRIGVI